MQNRKAAWPEEVTVQIEIKYRGHMLELRNLHLLNQCWEGNKYQLARWNAAEVISEN